PYVDSFQDILYFPSTTPSRSVRFRRIRASDARSPQSQHDQPDVGGADRYRSLVPPYGAQRTARAVARIEGAIPICAADVGLIVRSEEHTSELQSRGHVVCRLL